MKYTHAHSLYLCKADGSHLHQMEVNTIVFFYAHTSIDSCDEKWCIILSTKVNASSANIFMHNHFTRSVSHNDEMLRKYLKMSFIYVMFISSLKSSSSSFFTKRPFTRNLESAKFFRTSYLTRLGPNPTLSFAINLAILAL